MEKMTHIQQIPKTNSNLQLIYDFGEDSPI
jgi:hypothetical protein